MIGVALAFLGCWSILAGAPGTAIGRALHRLLVAAPAARLCALRRADVALAIVVIVSVIAMTTLDGTDPLRMAMAGLPDVAIWLTTMEVSVYLDLLVAVVVGLSGLRGRGGLRALKGTIVLRRAGGARARTARTRRPSRPAPANDDDGPAARPHLRRVYG